MRVYLARHASIEREYLKCYNGHIDIGLSALGFQEVEVLHAKLKSVPFDKVYSSDLLRTKQTVAPFTENYEVEYTKALREKSWGRHEGLTYDEVVKLEGVEYETFEQWLEVLDGEDYQRYIDRVDTFFQTLFSQNYDNVLVVTHAGVIRILIYLLQGISLEEAFSQGIGYAQYSVFDTVSNTFGYNSTKEKGTLEV